MCQFVYVEILFGIRVLLQKMFETRKIHLQSYSK